MNWVIKAYTYEKGMTAVSQGIKTRNWQGFFYYKVPTLHMK